MNFNKFHSISEEIEGLKNRFSHLYNPLKRIVDDYLDNSSYNEVDLTFLFQRFRPKDVNNILTAV